MVFLNGFFKSFFRACGTFFSFVSYLVLSTVVSVGLVFLIEPMLTSAVRVDNADNIFQQIYSAVQNSTGILGICIAITAGLVITLAICTLVRLNNIENKLSDIQQVIKNQK